jgi:hypothetical protein
MALHSFAEIAGKFVFAGLKIDYWPFLTLGREQLVG